MNYAVETVELTKTFLPPKGISKWVIKSPLSKPVTAVDAVSLSIPFGSIFGLIGANGAGKTTLIKMLCTLLWPTLGNAIVNGHDIRRDEAAVRKSIGLVVADERSFYWRLTGRQNLDFFASLYDLNREESHKRISELLEITGLVDSANSMFYSYSAGMKQKLAIARALMIRPKVLFLDEPTRSIDPVTAKEIKAFIRNVLVEQHGVTVFMTSHRLEEIEQLCDQIAVLNKGKILFNGTVVELREAVGLKQHYAIMVSGITNNGLAERLSCGGSVVLNTERVDGNGKLHIELSFDAQTNTLSDILNPILADGGTIHSCEKKDHRLEDAFIELMQGVN